VPILSRAILEISRKQDISFIIVEGQGTMKKPLFIVFLSDKLSIADFGLYSPRFPRKISVNKASE